MMEKFLLDAARVAPSPRQKRWFDIGFYAFVHFGVNTFTDREWGDGTEAESLFNPTDLDGGQRIESFKIVCEESGGTNFPLCQGATVGNRRLCRLENPFALQNPLTDDSTGRMRRLRLLVTASRGVPDLAAICAYGDDGEA